MPQVVFYAWHFPDWVVCALTPITAAIALVCAVYICSHADTKNINNQISSLLLSYTYITNHFHRYFLELLVTSIYLLNPFG